MKTTPINSSFKKHTTQIKRVIMITGASAGVGRAVVRELAGPNVLLGLIARGLGGLEGARKDAVDQGAEAHVFPVDVSNSDEVEKAARELEQIGGPIDVWVNVAMVSVFSPVHEMMAEEYKRVTEVTYLGYVYGTLAALKTMRPRNKGVIIQVGSALAYRSIPLQSAYCAAKHAILGFTESLRTELLHDKLKVQVVNVHLPAMNTPQFGWVKSRLPDEPQPVPPIYEPEVAARVIKWAIDHPRKEYWVGAPTVTAIIGERLAPWFADAVLARQGYSAQETDEPVHNPRRDNLWQPVPGDHGAHGTFGDRASDYSVQAWLSMHRPSIFALGVTSLALAAGYFLLRQGRKAVLVAQKPAPSNIYNYGQGSRDAVDEASWETFPGSDSPAW
jgi:short-subunit dehydrogenase